MATQNPIDNASYPFKSAALSVTNTTGDAAIQFSINTVEKWIMGSDDSDSDSFVIASGASLGTNNSVRISQVGSVTKPLQPSFLATSGATQSNVTGNGTIATVTYSSEIFDQNADYDGTNTFTAPITGKFLFTCCVEASGVTAASTTGTLQVVTSNRTYVFFNVNYGKWKDSSGIVVYKGAIFSDMDLADTCIIQISVTGEGANVVDLGLNATSSYFGGQLFC